MSITRSNDYEIVQADASGLLKAVDRLRNGGLAAFPTETVYGLGASALDSEAVKKIFALKGRPFSDPLIVHVSNVEMAYSLCELPEGWKKMFEVLAEAFWPGPLTLVVPASAIVPKTVTGGGETVGIRCPAHPVALKIISQSGLPLAAPSANRFGHVSPTLASHVAEDLGRDNLVIVDGGSCTVGIESTVLKILSEFECVILRRGAVSAASISEVFRAAGVKCIVSVRNRFVSKEVVQDSPGELLSHYSPVLPTFLVRKCIQDVGFVSEVALAECALVDIGGRFAEYRKFCGQYVDLSESGCMEEACERLFFVLRNLETMKEVKTILVPDLNGDESELAQAIADRLNRAAALKRAFFSNQSVRVDV